MHKLNLSKIAAGGPFVTKSPTVSDVSRVKGIVAEEPQVQQIADSCGVDVDLKKLANQGHGLINFDVQNTRGPGGVALNWGFGTLLNSPDTVVLGGGSAANLFAGNVDGFEFTTPGGATAPKTTGVAKSVLFGSNIIITGFRFIIDSSTALGQNQRAQQIFMRGLDIDLNRCDTQQSHPVSWSDLTGLVEDITIPIGLAQGFQYPILADSRLQITVYYSAIEIPTMTNADGSCPV